MQHLNSEWRVDEFFSYMNKHRGSLLRKKVNLAILQRRLEGVLDMISHSGVRKSVKYIIFN